MVQLSTFIFAAIILPAALTQAAPVVSVAQGNAELSILGTGNELSHSGSASFRHYVDSPVKDVDSPPKKKHDKMVRLLQCLSCGAIPTIEMPSTTHDF